MPGYNEIIVGYREKDPFRAYADFYGGRCVDCGHQVFYNDSARSIFQGADHDPTAVCRDCYRPDRHQDAIDAAMV